MSVSAVPAGRPVLLGSYAARSCPVKTQNEYDPKIASLMSTDGIRWEPDDALAELFDGGLQFEADVLDRVLAAYRGTLVDLRTLNDQPWPVRTSACLAAMRDGAEVIIGGLLPADHGGHRTGNPDLLIRGADQANGRPGYHAVEVKWHKVLERARLVVRPPQPPEATPGVGAEAVTEPAPPPPPRAIMISSLSLPALDDAVPLTGMGFRLTSREADLLQVAHYQRMLEACGFAADSRFGAVIGTDAPDGEPVLAWVDLDEPLIKTYSRTSAEGWRLRTILQRYDHEHRFRVDIARRALQQNGNPTDPPRLVQPIVTDECRRCQWWDVCRPQLDPDDVSLRIDKGPLDPREISALRRGGIVTITQLASTDLDGLLEWYLPEVRHRHGAESRLRNAARRAEMLLAGRSFSRETSGPIEVPQATYEIDFDVETAADHRVYLWGFLVNDTRTADAPVYHSFSRFTDLDEAKETALAVEAMTWLQGLVDHAALGGETVKVFHYSGYEVAMIRGISSRQETPPAPLSWALTYAEEHFVDLFELVRAHFFGVSGLGLKIIAQHAGFAWRDDDPGGLNSQRWFTEAVHADTGRDLARRRVLEYNEDDVIATARVRDWLRRQT